MPIAEQPIVAKALGGDQPRSWPLVDHLDTVFIRPVTVTSVVHDQQRQAFGSDCTEW